MPALLISLFFCQAAMPPRAGVGVIERKLSLADAIQMALANNLEIEIEKTNQAAAGQSIRAAEGAFDPIFRWSPSFETRNTPTASVLQGADGKLSEHFLNQDFSARYRTSRQGLELFATFDNARESTSSAFAALSPYLTSRLDIGFTQPLLRNREQDRERTEIRIRRKNLEIADTDFELKVIDVVTRVEQVYWDLVAARQDVIVAADAVNLAREQLGRNERMIASGSLAPVELSASRAELERRLDTFYTSVGVVTEIENVLKVLIAPSRSDSLWSDQIIPTDEKTMEPMPSDDLRESISQALKQRPELRQAALRQEANEIERAFNAGQLKPLVNLTATYSNTGLAGSVRPGDNPFSASNALLYARVNQLSQVAGFQPIPPPSFGSIPSSLVGGYGSALSNLFGGNFQSLQVGVAFELNLRNRTAQANLTQSAIAARRMKLEQARVEQAVEAEVRNALQGIQTARQRIQATQSSELAAREKLESETRLFQTGESTNFLVLTRQNELLDSRRRALAAQLDFNKAVARLEQATGSALSAHKITLK